MAIYERDGGNYHIETLTGWHPVTGEYLWGMYGMSTIYDNRSMPAFNSVNVLSSRIPEFRKNYERMFGVSIPSYKVVIRPNGNIVMELNGQLLAGDPHDGYDIEGYLLKFGYKQFASYGTIPITHAEHIIAELWRWEGTKRKI